jgi:uncharacterized protein (TIGR02117 family)
MIFFTSLIIISAVLLYVLSAILLGLIPYPVPESGCKISTEIYLASNGKHIDLILPPSMMEEAVLDNFGSNSFPEFIAVGWGDLDFYRHTPSWSDFSYRLAFSALFFQKQSAIHIYLVSNRDKSWKKVRLCDHQANALSDHIAASFVRERGIPVPAEAKSYGNTDKFFLANGDFSPILTCNEWVNRAFHFSGIKSPLWSPFDKALLLYYH